MVRTKLWKRLLAAGLCLSMALPFAGCGSKQDEADANSIKIMLMGDKPSGFDEVLAEFSERSKDELGFGLDITWVAQGDYKDKLSVKMMAGEDYDLVFDAPWCHLRDLAKDDVYTDLSPYLHNDKYPALKETFSEEYMDKNKYFGKNIYLPIEQGYGAGVNGILYRKDLSDKYGIGKIDSIEKLQKFFDAILENEKNMTPLAVTQSRGFYQFQRIDEAALEKANIQRLVVSNSPYYVLLNEERTQVVDIVPEGIGDEAFADFPKGFDYDFAMDRYELLGEWSKYLSKDSMSCLDADTPFFGGSAAAICGDIGSWYTNEQKMKQYIPEAEIDLFLDNPDQEAMEEGSIPTTYLANNCICIPEVSQKKDMAAEFLNWIFSSQENNDLFTLGIEGRDWKAGEDGTYEVLNLDYVFPGYTLTWNAKFKKFQSGMSDKIRKYEEYTLKEESYVGTPLAGFVFNQEPVKTEIAKVSAINSQVSTAMAHGRTVENYSSIKEMRKDNIDQCMKSGMQTIMDELEKQINEFLQMQ
ncbi:MAG: extracellular solute-binding protein [Lachnospiraceae bacterium]